MAIQIKGASEHNLQAVDVEIGEGLTVITGVSGSGKSSLVFDTLYHEAHRRFQDIYSLRSSHLRLSPAEVQSITGLGPAVAVGQNLLNRNPLSILATASGLHPFLRLLCARFGERHCPNCDAGVSVQSEDEIVERLIALTRTHPISIFAPILRRSPGSHRTLLSLLEGKFGANAIYIDQAPWSNKALDPSRPHDLDIKIADLRRDDSISRVRQIVNTVAALGCYASIARYREAEWILSHAPVCIRCGTWLTDLEPIHFHTPCPTCKGKGCPQCSHTGLTPMAAAVRWKGFRLPELLRLSVGEALALFSEAELPSTATRLCLEITRRLEALQRAGLNYLTLDRPSPTLSRGEAQRVRLAVILTTRLEDMLHILDEPTIGQHAADIHNLLQTFSALSGPVVFVEHDRMAAAAAERAIDLGPGAGPHGGKLLFQGSPAELWKRDTPTGRYFSMRQRVHIPDLRPQPDDFLTLHGVRLHNLRDIDVRIPLGRLTVISGVSGSGKSTLVEDVLVASLRGDHLVGCKSIEGHRPKPILVDQSPIGHNPRSNPATYTKLADIIRDIYAMGTGLSASHFSFNRPEGACPTCNGMGAIEIKMRYLPSTWIPCSDCHGCRFSEEVLSKQISFNGRSLSIADFYRLGVSEAITHMAAEKTLPERNRRTAERILIALQDIGLGYLPLGQPSPSLSGGEAQRVKLAKYLGRASLSGRLLVLDEPSTGLHPQDLAGLLTVLDRLTRCGATIVVVEHNLDIIRAADWIIDLGPGAGPDGGNVLYAGPLKGLAAEKRSLTGQAIGEEATIQPCSKTKAAGFARAERISVRGASAHNLRNVNVDFPKGALTVVTGVSGSGKSSLVCDVLEAEAQRRYLETLTLYERQGTSEGPEAPVKSITGLGVTVSVTPEKQIYEQRSTVGRVTEIWHHMAVLFALLGERACLQCGAQMQRGQVWVCPEGHDRAPIAQPRHFSPSHYAAACLKCHGIGTLRKPMPEKLIIHAEKPLCAGAMYSPGFFPQGYLCKPYNGGYYVVQALAERYGFDPMLTPWNEMSPQAQQAFLFGDSQPLRVAFQSRIGRTSTREMVFRGFYGWVGDWDVGGTYTETQICPDCHGSRLRAEYLAVTLAGYNIHQLSEMPLMQLERMLDKLASPDLEGHLALGNLGTALKRLRFLTKVGLGYLHLNRVCGTLSAGEAQRVKLAGLLGSGLTSLTVLLDEPSRGMHPSEVDALLDVLCELRDEGNTVIVVEHDPLFLRAADHLVDMGPGAGISGGEIVAQGRLDEVLRLKTLTAQWLSGSKKMDINRQSRRPRGWISIHGARENNLQGEDVSIPMGMLTGVCGVSGSGKSTLLIDTLGRALAPQKQTTSVAYEPIEPGAHDSIEGAPKRAILLDQGKRGVSSPLTYLDLHKPLLRLYADSEDGKALGVDEDQLRKSCTVCDGRGSIRIEMGFLPDVYAPCETCRGSGYRAEAWEIRLRGLALPELNGLTLGEVYELFKDSKYMADSLKAALDLGLGYLVLHQPGYALSGGEAQRLKIAKELSKNAATDTLYILDEPTVGQHLEDVQRLLNVLHRLVEAGHTVVVIEHHPFLLAACDWLIELGPGGGPHGGRIIAAGTPEQIAQGQTPTAPYLRTVIEAVQ